MEVKHVATKKFGGGKTIQKTVIYVGHPVQVQVVSDVYPLASEGKPKLRHNGSFKALMSLELTKGRDELKNSSMGYLVVDSEENLFPLGTLFNQGDNAVSDLEFSLEDLTTKDELRKIGQAMFPREDFSIEGLEEESFYTPLIPLVVLSEVLPPQITETNVLKFNAGGVVTVADFLDSLNAIYAGCNSNKNRGCSLDGVSGIYDYFNEGYLSCLQDNSSYFYGLYTRAEFLRPITRAEMAYIIVCCWSGMREAKGTLYESKYKLGYTFDWTKPAIGLSAYEDGFAYKTCEVELDLEGSESDSISPIVDLNSYKNNLTLTEYLELLKEGKRALPLPMLASLVELGSQGLYYFDQNNLDPLREVTRGELSYLLVQLAKNFTRKESSVEQKQ